MFLQFWRICFAALWKVDPSETREALRLVATIDNAEASPWLITALFVRGSADHLWTGFRTVKNPFFVLRKSWEKLGKGRKS